MDDQYSGQTRIFRPLIVLALLMIAPAPGKADNLKQALIRAFQANPALNAQRFGTLATREAVAQARARYFPRVTATADTGRSTQSGQIANLGGGNYADYKTRPHGYGLQATQVLFDGFRTYNSVRQAGAQTSAAEQGLRALEQSTLYDAVAAYTSVLRDRELVDLNRRNTAFLRREQKLVTGRHSFGDVTQSDVAQATTRLASGLLKLEIADQRLRESSAIYQQVIGADPGQLAPPRPIDQRLPRDLPSALALAQKTHPAILAARFTVDAANSEVDIVNGEFAPTVSVSASVSKRYDNSLRGDSQLSQSVIGQISVPLFEGGVTLSRSRQAKQVLGQRRLEGDVAFDQVRATLVTAWGQLNSTKSQVLIAKTQYEAAGQELSDMTLQYRYGQKTLADVLNASQDVLDAGSNLITANRERITASFALLRATGQLTLDNISADLADAPAVVVGQFPEALDRKGPLDIGLKRTSVMSADPCWLDCPASLDNLALRPGTEPGNTVRSQPPAASRKLPDVDRTILRR